MKTEEEDRRVNQCVNELDEETCLRQWTTGLYIYTDRLKTVRSTRNRRPRVHGTEYSRILDA